MSGVMVGQVGQSVTANSRTVRKSMRQFVKSMVQLVSTMETMEPWLVPMLPSTTIHMIIVPRLLTVMSNMISEYGASAFTHETTHLNDRIAYFGDYDRREGTDV